MKARLVGIIVAVAVAIALAAYSFHFYQVQTARSSLRKKIAFLQTLDSFSTGESVQQIKYLRLDITKARGTISNDERDLLTKLVTLIAAWSYFTSQPASAMRLDKDAMTELSRADVPPSLVWTSPELEEFLEVRLKARLYADLIRADRLPSTASGEVAYLQTYLQNHPVEPQPSESFYNPKTAAGIIAATIASTSATLSRQLNGFQWF
jgi:hypothetical protein